MENDIICPQCEGQYKEDNPPRLFMGCGHTFCQSCFKKIMIEKDGNFTIVCPEDGEQVNLKNDDVNNIPKNIALLKILQSKKGNSSFKDPQLEMSKIVNSQEAHNDDEEARQIVAAIVLSSSAGSQQKICFEKEDSTKLEIPEEPAPKQIKQVKVQQKCKYHQKPLEVVCIIDLKKICVNCAIFGEHKGHQFKSLQEIQNERVGYYSSILEIMDKKQSISQRISSQQTCSSIMEILANKKLKMRNSINQKFKKLIQAIESKQKQSLKSLDLIMQKTETKLKNLMKIDAQVLQRYDSWQQKSYEQIKILQGEDFQAKLQLLFSETAEQVDVIQEGTLTIESMNKQEENLITEVESTLENIGLQFNNQILNHIDGFVDIFDEVKKKKPKIRVSKLQIQTSNLSNSPSQNNLNKGSILQKKQKAIEVSQQIFNPLPINNNSKSICPYEQMNLPKKQQLQPQTNVVHNQQSLLQVEEETLVKKPQFVKTTQIPTHLTQKPILEQPPKIAESPLRRQKNVVSPSTKFSMKNPNIFVSQQMSPRMSKVKKEEFQFPQKIEKPNKKKLAKLKLPEKYDKILESLANDQLQALDLTNAQLGDNTITLISEFLLGSKVKTVKFIRNKLSDDGVSKMIPYIKGIITLNLSQNLLTDRVLDILIQNRSELQLIKTVILSQNKINSRNAKIKLDKLKSLDIVVSL